MIKGALQWIKDQAQPPRLAIGSREYSTIQLHPVYEPRPEALGVHTLSGIVDYVAAQEGLKDMGPNPSVFLQVVSHQEVRLLTRIEGPFCQRTIFLGAKLPENSRYPFGAWQDPETFIIELQAKFVPDDNIKALLTFVSSIKEANDRTSMDDGISQTVTAKTGVALVTETKVPNPVTLRPYRTFLEVQQPGISCVLRLRQGPMLSLHEADGGLWRLEAIQSIKTYLEDAIANLNQKIPVIA